MSLALRFIRLISLLVLATSGLLSLFFIYNYSRVGDDQIRKQGISLARNLAHNAELGVLTRNTRILGELANGVLLDNDVIGVTVMDADGAPLLETRKPEMSQAALVALPGAVSIQVGVGTALIAPYGLAGSDRIEAYEISYQVFTRRGERRNEEIGFLLEEEESSDKKLEGIGSAHVMLTLAGRNREVAELAWAFGLLTALVISLAILLTITMVKRLVSPLQALADATRRIASGSLDQVIETQSQDEIGQLARAFNTMTSELSRSRRELEMYSADLENQVRLRTRELEEAQTQLVQAEKMSAVGLLVSGVAHELNNPLAGVVGYAQLLLKGDTDERTRRGLEKINREAERCKKIVQNLQTFARKHAPQKDYVGVNGILESTLELRSYQLKVDNISIATDLDPELPKTMADFHQLQQVFLNIMINAHQAMVASGKPGTLTLRSRQKGETIQIEIQDNGPGIQPENLSRIFDPFFTTKEVGQGTGLGLSICYGIIQEHKGRIAARNAAAGGAIFSVELPIIAAPEQAPVEEPAGAPAPGQSAPPRNILVVDDELAIIDILYQVLRMDGHRVDTALNGQVALRKIEKDRYDLIISDLKMPGMGGQELYHRVRAMDLDLSRRIIFSTGDTVSTDTRDFLEKSGNSYLQKPFDMETIRRVVRTVLLSTAQ